MCPVCGVPLELATEAPQANRERAFILREVAAKLTASEPGPLDSILLKYLVNINGRKRFLLTE